LKQDALQSFSTTGGDVNNSDVLAIVNTSILTMETGNFEDDLMLNAVVVTRGGLIESVGSKSNVQVPKGATIFDAEGGISLYFCV
jgi:imidazolonepropionase-like amidohydrolase